MASLVNSTEHLKKNYNQSFSDSSKNLKRREHFQTFYEASIPNPHAGRRSTPARSPGRQAVTDLRFRARKLQVGVPRAADRAGTSLATAPCPPRGPAPEGRTRGQSPGSSPRRALTSPRRRVWAAAALRLAVVEAGAGKEERGPRRTASPRRDRGHRTAAAPPPPQLARWPFAGRGRLIPASDSGAPRSGAAALAGRADVACVSLPPPAPHGRERPRVRTEGQLRGAGPKGGRSARAHWRAAPQGVRGGVGPLVSQEIWSGGQGTAKRPSALTLSGGRPQGLSAAAGIPDPLTLHSFSLRKNPGRRGRSESGARHSGEDRQAQAKGDPRGAGVNSAWSSLGPRLSHGLPSKGWGQSGLGGQSLGQVTGERPRH